MNPSNKSLSDALPLDGTIPESEFSSQDFVFRWKPSCSCSFCGGSVRARALSSAKGETSVPSESLTGAFSSDGTALKTGFSLQSSIFRWKQPNGKGSPITLTYSYDNLFDGTISGGISSQEMKSAIEESLRLWARYAPLNFVEVEDTGKKSQSNPDAADIRIGHRDIGGRGGTLGEAELTYFGDLAVEVDFDNQDDWQADWTSSTFDFVAVAVHEIGHALGLNHEDDAASVMNPFARDIYSGLGTAFIYEDDINGIRALYGKGVGSLTTLEPDPASLPEPVLPPVEPEPVEPEPVEPEPVEPEPVEPEPVEPEPVEPEPVEPIRSNAYDVFGTNGDDVIFGSRRSQTFESLNGDDKIRAGGGDDVVCGGKGDDQLFGGGNEDSLFGGANNDFIDGGEGNDELIGGLGDDSLVGGLGDDTLMGGKGQDTLLGTSIGGDGLREQDVLVGGAKADLFVLGDRTRAFYDDGSSGTIGLSDYALISDFKRSDLDQIQLHGSAADYLIGTVPDSSNSDQGIFLKTEGKAELIGIVRGDSALILESPSFTFV